MATAANLYLGRLTELKHNKDTHGFVLSAGFDKGLPRLATRVYFFVIRCEVNINIYIYIFFPANGASEIYANLDKSVGYNSQN